MLPSNWRDEVSLALSRQGLPRAYIRRFMDELSDHFEDLVQENVSMDADTLNSRLGSPVELANCAGKLLGQRTYAGKHPWITFVLAPLPATALVLVGLCMVFLGVLSSVPAQAAGEPLSFWQAMALQALVWALRYAPFAIAATMFCLLARRGLLAPRWSLTACCLVSLWAGLFAISLTLPTGAPGSGSLVMGFSLPPAIQQLPQALAPLVVWLVFRWRDARLTGEPLVPHPGT